MTKFTSPNLGEIYAAADMPPVVFPLAVCWPNGLELSPTKLRETCVAPETA